MKYIRQFAIVQQDEVEYEREFKSDVERRRSAFVDDYLSGLKVRVLDDVMKVDAVKNDRALGRYVETLLQSAAEVDRSDAFSKAALFSEVEFHREYAHACHPHRVVRQVIENVEFRSIIDKHVEARALKSLARELIELLWARALDVEKKKAVNNIVKDVKAGLKVRTAAVQVEDVDLTHLPWTPSEFIDSRKSSASQE